MSNAILLLVLWLSKSILLAALVYQIVNINFKYKPGKSFHEDYFFLVLNIFIYIVCAYIFEVLK